MKPKTWKYIKAASKNDKAEMQAQIDAENDFQKIEPQGIDDEANEFPISYKLENHDGYQMQAYNPAGKSLDGFHESFIRCGSCGGIITFTDNDDSPQFCWHCFEDLPEYDY